MPLANNGLVNGTDGSAGTDVKGSAGEEGEKFGRHGGMEEITI